MKRLLACMLLIMIGSCAKITESEIPYAPVRFDLNLNYSDKDLVPLLSFKEFTAPRLAGEHTGYAGLLLVHSYDEKNQFMAYDRCCPHEAQREVVIIPGNRDGTAACPKCKTVYDIANGGFPLSGPSKFALRRYGVTTTGKKIQVYN